MGSTSADLLCLGVGLRLGLDGGVVGIGLVLDV